MSLVTIARKYLSSIGTAYFERKLRMRQFTTLSDRDLHELETRLRSAHAELQTKYPGVLVARQPVHVFYGGAHLFRADNARKLGDLALRSLDEFAPDSTSLARALEHEAIDVALYTKIRNKMALEPIEDLRIDFEDGYGIRPDEEEDRHAAAAAHELAQAIHGRCAPPFLGIRIKPLNLEFLRRSLRTLDIFFTELAAKLPSQLPSFFSITLPKVALREEVEMLASVCGQLEAMLNMPSGWLRIELMVERTQAIFDAKGTVHILALVEASGGRCSSVHFGPHDYAASRNLLTSDPLTHFAANFARETIQVALGGTGVRLVDGPTNLLPVLRHAKRGEELDSQQQLEDIQAVHLAWKMHFLHIRRSMEQGFYQGWDLHPAQLPIRYAATYSFFLEKMQTAAERIRHFLGAATQATRLGQLFDDAAMAQELLHFVSQAVRCGAVAPDDAERLTGLKLTEISEGSFLKILTSRR
jgi:citrate lyase beta subunit